MRISALFVIGCVLLMPTSAREYYRWVDENGTIHFSDLPPELNIDINIDITTYSFDESIDVNRNIKIPLPVIPPEPPGVVDILEELEFLEIATRIRLASPQNDATIRNNQGDIAVKVNTNNPLGDNQWIRVLLDGKIHAKKQSNLITLKNIDRGSHTLAAQLLENGKVIAKTKRITVFLHRAILHKTP